MHLSFVFLCVLAGISAVFCAVAFQLPVEKPSEMALQEGCYLPEINKVLPYNTPYSPQDGTKCVQFTCTEDNITSIFSCGALLVSGDGCDTVPGDKSLPYPDCCDTSRCNTVNSIL